MRSKSTRCPPASTIAMLTGLRNSFARRLLASSILRATSIDKLTRDAPYKKLCCIAASITYQTDTHKWQPMMHSRVLLN